MDEKQHTSEPTPIEPTPVDKPMPKKSKAPAILAIASGLLVLVLGVSGGLWAGGAFDTSKNTIITSTVDGNNTVTQEESNIASIAEQVSASVVSIVTETQARSYYGTTSQEGAGTGIIVSADGYIMTNNHVIESTTNVSVVDSEGELYDDVTIIGRDPLNDVAFLKINSNDTFKPAVLGNSETIRIGQQVIAIGNALGQYNNTVTSGIISGTGRPVTAQTASGETESLTDLLQTDASINPGNSGGPLVNMAGQVIGINTAIAADANGIGFAIPINATKGVLAGVLENGKVNRAFMGVNYLSITPDIAREYDLPVREGAYIYAEGASPISANGPAANAGLQQGDIIQKVNQYTLSDQGSLSSIIGQYRPGEKVTITYLRDGNERTTELTFGTYRQ